MFTSRLVKHSDSWLLKLIDMNDPCTLICQRFMIKWNLRILMFPYFSLSLFHEKQNFDSWGQFSFLSLQSVASRSGMLNHLFILRSWGRNTLVVDRNRCNALSESFRAERRRDFAEGNSSSDSFYFYQREVIFQRMICFANPNSSASKWFFSR